MSEHEARATIQPSESDATAQRVEARSGQADSSAGGRDGVGAPSVEQRAVANPPRRRRRAVAVDWSSKPIAPNLLDLEPDDETGPTDDVPLDQRAPSDETRPSGPEAVAGSPEQDRKTRKRAPRRLTWRPGKVVGGRYLLRRNLGVGGTGLVVVADDLLLRKSVAVKALRPSVARDPANVERFRKEVALCHAITHPNIVRSYDIGEDEGVHYFSMEYLEGQPLSDHLRDSRAMSPAEVRRLFIPVCHALQAAHDALIVHRDLKPSNIMLVPEPRRVVVMDFGISGLVEESSEIPEGATDPSGPVHASNPSIPRPADWDVTSAGWGTPKYMSPEQWTGEPCGPQSDIYSLGAIIFQCLTGRPPFLAHDDRTFAALHVKREAPRLREVKSHLPRDLEVTVARCLAKKPEERYQTAAELADALSGRRKVPPWLRVALRALVLAVVMAAFGWAIITVSNQAIVREMRPAVQRLAVLTALNVDVADLDAIHEAEDYTGETFQRVRNYFLEVAERNPDAFYIYTLRALESPGEWEFVVDKDPFAEDDNQNGVIDSTEQGAMPGQYYDGRQLSAMTAALIEGRPTADDDFVWDPYGMFLSGYAPLGDNRGPGGYILGVDVTNRPLRIFNRVVLWFFVAVWVLLAFAPVALQSVRRRMRSRLATTTPASEAP